MLKNKRKKLVFHLKQYFRLIFWKIELIWPTRIKTEFEIEKVSLEKQTCKETGQVGDHFL